MDYSVIDPSVYGVKLVPTSSTSNSKPRKQTKTDTSSSPARQDKQSSRTSQNIPYPSTEAQNDSVARRESMFSVFSSRPESVPTTGGCDQPEPTRKRQPDRIEQATNEPAAKKARQRSNNGSNSEVDPEENVYSDDPNDDTDDSFMARFEAEAARRRALSPKARQKEDIKNQKRRLQGHIKPQLITDMAGFPMGLHYYPLFILQLAPDSRNGSTCRLAHCIRRIQPGQYRIALTPGMSDPRGPDFYHVRCFEYLLHHSCLHYAARFDTDRKKHIPDRGAQCILEEYISRWKLRLTRAPTHQDNSSSPTAEGASGTQTQQNVATEIEQGEFASSNLSDGSTKASEKTPAPSDEEVSKEAPSTSSPVTARQLLSVVKDTVKRKKWDIADDMYEELRKAEVQKYRERTQRTREYFFHSKSDHEDNSWDVTQYLLPEDHPEYSKRHALSHALRKWEIDVELATTDTDRLTEARRQAQEALNIDKIREYSCVPMQSFLF